MTATAEDYGWFIDSYTVGVNFCVSFVRGAGPDEVIRLVGGPEPVAVESVAGLETAADEIREMPDLAGVVRNTGLTLVAATTVGAWTVIIEPNGFLCSTAEIVPLLSGHGELVTFYYNENTSPRFVWARDGEVLARFDPSDPFDRGGSSLDDLLRETGFTGPGDFLFQERTFAVMERLTGVRLTAGLLAGAVFRCAAVPDAVRRESGVARRVLDEAREELAAFAGPAPAPETTAARRWREARERRDRESRVEHDTRRWSGRLPGSDRLRALESRAIGLAGIDRDLVDEIADAATPAQRAMAVWAARSSCEIAGLLGSDWVAEAVDALDRGNPPPPAFADFKAAYARWRGVARESITWSSSVRFEPSRSASDPAVMALHAVLAAREPDPLAAAIEAVKTTLMVNPDPAAGVAAFRAAFALPR